MEKDLTEEEGNRLDSDGKVTQRPKEGMDRFTGRVESVSQQRGQSEPGPALTRGSVGSSLKACVGK